MRRQLPALIILSLLALLLMSDAGSTMLEHHFLYFPSADLYQTPAAAGLDFEDVTLTTEDGIRLHAWYVPGEPSAPVLLFCHGNAGNMADRVEQLRFLHRLGVSILLFDYRGYGRSEGRTDEAGTYADARAARAWLERRAVPAERIVYYGRSLGAAVALRLATEHPPAGLVLETPFSSVSAMGRHHYPLLYLLFGWAFDAEYDSQARIGNSGAPLLVLAGADDEIAPLAMARQLFNAAPDPKRLYVVPGAGHNDLFFAVDDGYERAWADFLHKSGR